MKTRLSNGGSGWAALDWLLAPLSAALLTAGLLTAALLVLALPGTVLAQDLPQAAYVTGVTGHAQGYSLSCESRSAADWAAFWGVTVSESDFLANLPRSDDPDSGFVGSPYDIWGSVPPYSYGVYPGPVAQLLRAYGLEAQAQRGMKWKELRAEIAAGRPAIVWVIGQMWPGSPRAYTAANGHTVTVAPYEHTMILTGYALDSVQVVDAYSGRTQTYLLEPFLASWAALGNMAVTGGLPVSALEPTATPTPESAAAQPAEQTYTVQRGDYLLALAERFQTSWTALVNMNAIPYPYTIYPGQVLQLPAGDGAPPAPTATPTPQPTGTAAQPTAAVQNTATPAGAAAGPDTYSVQPGDYLKKIAERYGLDWRALAELNGIGYPYVIYSGQVLRLK